MPTKSNLRSCSDALCAPNQLFQNAELDAVCTPHSFNSNLRQLSSDASAQGSDCTRVFLLIPSALSSTLMPAVISSHCARAMSLSVGDLRSNLMALSSTTLRRCFNKSSHTANSRVHSSSITSANPWTGSENCEVVPSSSVHMA